MDIKRKIILLVILVLGIAGILGLIYYGRQLRLAREEMTEDREESKRKVVNPLGLKIPEEVYYYVGTIKGKSVDSLVILALAQDNFLTTDKEFIVQIDQNTRLRKYQMPVYLKPGQNPKDFAVGHGQTSLSDFKLGDRVTVYASEDIKGKSEFVASEIRAVEYD